MIIIDETDTRFYIEKSTIPDAGLGLFAKEFIKKGDWLEVIGVMVKNNSISDRCTYYAHHYKFLGAKLDAKIVPMGYAGIINHTSNKQKQNMQLTHIRGLSKRSQHSSEIVYQALRDIMPGEELLGNYGDKMAASIDKLFAVKNEQNISEWERFLAFNLYDLPRILETLN